MRRNAVLGRNLIWKFQFNCQRVVVVVQKFFFVFFFGNRFGFFILVSLKESLNSWISDKNSLGLVIFLVKRRDFKYVYILRRF